MDISEMIQIFLFFSENVGQRACNTNHYMLFVTKGKAEHLLNVCPSLFLLYFLLPGKLDSHPKRFVDSHTAIVTVLYG